MSDVRKMIFLEGYGILIDPCNILSMSVCETCVAIDVRQGESFNIEAKTIEDAYRLSHSIAAVIDHVAVKTPYSANSSSE